MKAKLVIECMQADGGYPEAPSYKAKLEEIIELAQKAYSELGEGDLPPWVQDKIVEAKVHLEDVNSWIHGMEEEKEGQEEGPDREMDSDDHDNEVDYEEDAIVEKDKWIQDAVDPKHKGYCTPMSKKTCTPHRKALAKRFKKGI